MDDRVGPAYLAEAVRVLRQYKRLGDRAIAQVAPEAVFRPLDAESNSIAILIQHLAGNMRSRWTDFLTTDGEKPDRNRDAEFEAVPGSDLAALLEAWEEGWRLTLDAVESLRPDDLLREVRIRGEPLSVLQAVDRQVCHYAYHVGQIVLLAKHARGPEWETLSMPRRRPS